MIAAATSDSDALRPSGLSLAVAAVISSAVAPARRIFQSSTSRPIPVVGQPTGQTQLTVTPSDASSTAKDSRSPIRPNLLASAPLREELLEALEIERVLTDLEHVPRRSRPENAGGQHLSQPRHVQLDHLGRRFRHLLAPEGLDELLQRDGVIRVEKEPGEERPLLAPAELERRATVAYLERP